MARPVGYYSYSYKFTSVGLGDIISSEKLNALKKEGRVFIFEMRSEFLIKYGEDTIEAETLGAASQIIGSERYDISPISESDTSSFYSVFQHRLVDYWMSEDEINVFCEKAIAFVSSLAADLVPVAVHFEICTLQQKGEYSTDTWERAILPHKLFPLHLWPVQTAVNKPLGSELRTFLFSLRKTRATSDEGAFDLMPFCTICQSGAYTGDQITKLLSCRCAFHYQCIVEELEKSNLCPKCTAKVYDSRLLE